jgi:membrane protease YdiL (CAAX protease family)
MIVNPTLAFLLDIALVALLFVAIVAYVKKHLRALLIELCGTTERASFWLAFSNVTLVLVPLIFALDYKPEFGPEKTAIFEMATQLRYALIGFVITLGSLALILVRFIPRDKNTLAGVPHH